MDTYREERMINRRSRARKARIAGRVIGFGLAICLAVGLRTDPQMRAMVEELALAAMGAADGAGGDHPQVAGIDALDYPAGSEEARLLDELGISGEADSAAPTQSHMPQSRIKVNRGASR